MSIKQAGILVGGIVVAFILPFVAYLMFEQQSPQIAAILSFLWGLSLFIRLSSELNRDETVVGGWLTYLLTWVGWPFAMFGSYTTLILDAQVADFSTKALLSVIGVGLPESINPLWAGVLIFVIGATYFQISNTVVLKYWKFVEDVTEPVMDENESPNDAED
ncbi:hypothetical protein [Haloferax sp. YSSS75]|uniref:hypothetical protein n=1 Tax=Haloferax sp. YSSS75 TaxID=3388564 RepID=UPI00398CC63C